MMIRVFQAQIKLGYRAKWTELVKLHSFPLLTGVP